MVLFTDDGLCGYVRTYWIFTPLPSVIYTVVMLLVLPYSAQAVASPQLLVGLRILFSYSCDVSLNDVWSNSLRNLTYLVASISGIAFGILDLKANGIS